MNMLKRIKRVTVGRIEQFLSAVEDPEVVFPQLIRELEQQAQKAYEAEAEALASLRQAERAHLTVQERIERLGQGAEAALSRNDEETAREAVEAQINDEKLLDNKTQAVEQAERTYTQAKDGRERLAGQLNEIKSKRDEIITRARVARTQKSVERTLNKPVAASGSILDAVERMELQVEQSEAELEVQRELAGKPTASVSLERRLDALEQQDEVELRFAALKSAHQDAPST
jgi:phage shock protein A